MEDGGEASRTQARQARRSLLKELSPKEAQIASKALKRHSSVVGAAGPICWQSIDSVLIQFSCLRDPLRRASGLRFA